MRDCVSTLQSYVGSVLLSLGSSSKVAGPQFVPSFASSVLRSLAFSCQDQSVLINGYHTSEKNKLANSLLSNLMALLEYQPTMSSVTVASELIDHLSCCEADNGLKAVVTKTLIVHPYSLGLKGAHFSCLLLDTSNLAGFEVLMISALHQALYSRYRLCIRRRVMFSWSLHLGH